MSGLVDPELAARVLERALARGGDFADLYVEDTATAALATAAITPVGGSQPHTNFQPYMGINFIISLFGIFPRFS